MISLRPSSSAAISSVVTTPSRLHRRSFATARIWSLTATTGCPSQEIGIAVRRFSFRTFTEITTQGRVLRISEPSVGSSATHQLSPRRILSQFRSRPGPDWQSRRRESTRNRDLPVVQPAPHSRSANGRVRALLRSSCTANGSGTLKVIFLVAIMAILPERQRSATM